MLRMGICLELFTETTKMHKDVPNLNLSKVEQATAPQSQQRLLRTAPEPATTATFL